MNARLVGKYGSRGGKFGGTGRGKGKIGQFAMGTTKTPQTRSSRAGLIFPVGRIHRYGNRRFLSPSPSPSPSPSLVF